MLQFFTQVSSKLKVSSIVLRSVDLSSCLKYSIPSRQLNRCYYLRREFMRSVISILSPISGSLRSSEVAFSNRSISLGIFCADILLELRAKQIDPIKNLKPKQIKSTQLGATKQRAKTYVN